MLRHALVVTEELFEAREPRQMLVARVVAPGNQERLQGPRGGTESETPPIGPSTHRRSLDGERKRSPQYLVLMHIVRGGQLSLVHVEARPGVACHHQPHEIPGASGGCLASAPKC